MLRSRSDGYGPVAIVLHWLIAIIFIGQLAVGTVMTRLEDQRLVFDLIQWHKSFGLLLLSVAVLRIGWRLANPPPPFPQSMPAWERRAARLSHGLLYILQLALPLSGWLLVSVSVLGIPTFAFYLIVVPHLPVASSERAEELSMFVHTWLGYGAIALLAIHITAAFRHHFILKDNVLRRMLRPVTKA